MSMDGLGRAPSSLGIDQGPLSIETPPIATQTTVASQHPMTRHKHSNPVEWVIDDTVSSAFGNSFRNCSVNAASLGPNCAKQTPRPVAAIRSGPRAVLRWAYAMVSPSPPARYEEGVMPRLRMA